MHKSFVIVIFFCVLVLGVAAQDHQTAILVDEFASVGCCEFRGRIDVFLAELANNPTNVGVVVTGGPRENFVAKVIREEMTRSHIRLRDFDPSRLRFVRVETEAVGTRFWRVPIGSAMPDLRGANNTYNVSIDTPTLLLTDYPHGDGGLCPEVEDREMFALFLIANSTSRGRMVIRGFSQAASNKIERDLKRFFVNVTEIDQSRLQFASSRQTDGSGFGPSIEYWLLP